MTPQYAGLRTLQETYGDRGLVVMGFPCNQFGEQEPGTDAEILEFATSTYGVNFPMFSKVEVNGDGACELFKLLTAALPKKDGSTEVAWNFTKFVVGRDGTPLRRYEPRKPPEDFGSDIAELL